VVEKGENARRRQGAARLSSSPKSTATISRDVKPQTVITFQKRITSTMGKFQVAIIEPVEMGKPVQGKVVSESRGQKKIFAGGGLNAEAPYTKPKPV